MAKFQNIKLPDLSSDPTVESGYYQIYFKGGEPYYVDSSDNVTKLIPDLDKSYSYLGGEATSDALYAEEISGGEYGNESTDADTLFPSDWLAILHVGVSSNDNKAFQIAANYSDSLSQTYRTVNSPIYMRSSYNGSSEWKEWGRLVMEDNLGSVGIHYKLEVGNDVTCNDVIIR